MATVVWILGPEGPAHEASARLLASAGMSLSDPGEPLPAAAPAVAVLVDPSIEHWAAARDSRVPVVLVIAEMDPRGTAEAVLRGAEAVVCIDSCPSLLIDTVERVAGGATILDPVAARALATMARDNVPRSVTLTPREKQIIASIAKGDSVKQTARLLGISTKTVENLQGRLYRKLRVRNRAQAVARAHLLGLIPE